jgi:hypothetical protein
VKVLWVIGLIVAIVGILMLPGINVIDINILKIANYWVVIAGVALLAIGGFPKAK